MWVEHRRFQEFRKAMQNLKAGRRCCCLYLKVFQPFYNKSATCPHRRDALLIGFCSFGLTFSYISVPTGAETIVFVERDGGVWGTSCTQTCTKLEPRLHLLFHCNMLLQNAAVARAWGTFSEVPLSTFIFCR